MDTKREILVSALELFSGSGYEAVGIQQICAAAGITKPSLYYHFGNKETLLAEVAGDAASGLLDTLTGSSQGITFSGDLVADIRSLFSEFLQFSRRNPARFQIILQMLYPPQGSTIGQVGRAELHRINSTLVRFFTIAAGAHGNLAGKEQFLAAVFLGHAVALAMYLSHTDTSAQQDGPDVVLAAQTFLYGVF